MSHKNALLLSLALTVFTLTILGGVLFAVRGAPAAAAPAQAEAVQAEAAPAEAAAIDTQALQAAVQEREAAYRDLIAQANARLEQAQRDQQALQAQLDSLQAGTTVESQPAYTSITPEQAAQVASAYLGKTDVYSIESVTFNGAAAYQVTFSSGAIVTVDLSGQVVAVKPAPRAATIKRLSTGEHEDHDGREEHDGREDHDD